MKYIYFGLLTLTLLATSSMAVAESSISTKKNNQYPAEFMQDYAQECIQTSMGEGLDEAEAQKLCDCTINEFQQQYSLSEFKQLTAASATDEQAETALVEVGQVCFEQILYE
ncbi:hypothetical protein [Pleurocapsa sp. PCC 7319]|uniref:hypothetical protein n=1 Tax=Pleurocapsa sp. PCC 7319 TaxID=118161 RepID=UPI00034BBBB1|nr:hypothetical protein [Pleurocapsa sp. PCC 7319]